MSEDDVAARPPAERVDDLPRIVAAMRRAVRRALAEHRRSGNPIATWRDGAVVWIAPEDIPLDTEAEEPPREAAVAGKVSPKR